MGCSCAVMIISWVVFFRSPLFSQLQVFSSLNSVFLKNILYMFLSSKFSFPGSNYAFFCSSVVVVVVVAVVVIIIIISIIIIIIIIIRQYVFVGACLQWITR